MKNSALLLGTIAVLVVSCSVREEGFGVSLQEDCVFYGSFELPAEATKVYSNEDLYLRWTSDDRVSIFNKNTYNQQYRFLGETGDNAGGFGKVDGAEFVTGNLIADVISVYPYRKGTKITEKEVLSLTLPAEQPYAENSFGLGANTMVSVSTGNLLYYKNVGGYLMLKLYGEGVSVSSITLKGNNGEKLAGNATVSMPVDGDPSVSMASDASTEITLTCETPVQLGATAEEATQFWFVVPPVTFSKGFTVTVSADDGVFEKNTDKPLTIDRNNLSKMSPIAVKLSRPKNVIYYTSSDGSVVSPSRTNVFGANIISNEYVDGQGIITFDGPVTRIGIYAFKDCTNLTGITLPESVVSIGVSAFISCSSLSGFTIPDSVTSIGGGAFSECTSLMSFSGKYASSNGLFLIDSGSLVAVAWGAFDGKITIPSGVTRIGDYAFSECTSLTSISIPESVTSIGNNAFYNCSSLARITIPKSVTSIGESAFRSCRGLTRITVKPEIPPAGGGGMFDNTRNAPIFVPFNSIDTYKSTQYWSNYASLIQDVEFVWGKTLVELNIPAAYNRLAYSATGSLLVSDGEKVHAMNPVDGTYWKSIIYPDITPASICSDDAGNVIVVPNVTAEIDWDTNELLSGKELTIYYSADPNEMMNSIIVPNLDYGTLGGVRVRGNLADKAVITGVVGTSRSWFGYDIQNYAAVPNYFGTQNHGPGPGNYDFWGPESAAAVSLGTSLQQGILFRGYDGEQSLYYLADAYTPNSVSPPNWVLLSTLGSGGNENQNNLAIADYKGRTIVAYTQGLHFVWPSNDTVYLFDVTDISDVKQLMTLNLLNDVENVPEFTEEETSSMLSKSSSADVLLHPTDECLELYVVNSSRKVMGKYKIGI